MPPKAAKPAAKAARKASGPKDRTTPPRRDSAPKQATDAKAGPRVGSAASPSGAARRSGGGTPAAAGVKFTDDPVSLPDAAGLVESQHQHFAAIRKALPKADADKVVERTVCTAALMLTGEKAGWVQAKEAFAEGTDRVKATEPFGMRAEQTAALREYAADAKLTPVAAAKHNEFAAALCVWLRALAAAEAAAPKFSGSTGLSTEPLPRTKADEVLAAVTGDDWKAAGALAPELLPSVIAGTVTTATSVFKELKTTESFDDARHWCTSTAQYIDDFRRDDVPMSVKTLEPHRRRFVTDYCAAHPAATVLPQLEGTGLKAVHAMALWLHAVGVDVAEAVREEAAAAEAKAAADVAAAAAAEAAAADAAAAAEVREQQAKDMQAKYGCRPLPFKRMKVETEQLWDAGKTPLLVGDVDGQAQAFYRYNATVMNAKGLVLRQVMEKVPLEDIREEMRQQLVASLKYGKVLHVDMDNSATDFKKLYDPASLPDHFWFHSEMSKEERMKAILTPEEVADKQTTAWRQDQYRCVVTSKFKFDEYKEYLADSIPLDRFEVLSLQFD